MNPVPTAYLGVWRRTLLTTRAGRHDASTEVYWLQTATLHADLRIPQPMPVMATDLELAEQAGFAGLTVVESDICQWHRLMDYQPFTGESDIGRMRFETPDIVIEDALDGSYQETWERLPDSLGANWGLWLNAAEDPSRQACLLVAGDFFLFAAERPTPLRPGGHLRDQVAAASAVEPQTQLAFELSFGRRQQGAAPWLISLSTLPGRAGQSLLPAHCTGETADALDAADLACLGRHAPFGGWIIVPCPTLATGQETLP
jgi:hypothetical protein